MIAWPWQKGGKELCPQGGRHDWEVVRSLTDDSAKQEAIREMGGREVVIPSPSCGEERRYEDRVCLKCHQVELHAHKAIQAAKQAHQDKQTRRDMAVEIIMQAVGSEAIT